jgi:AcrR family transcriptional regulator
MTDSAVLVTTGFTGTVLDREALLPPDQRRTRAVEAFWHARRLFLKGLRIDMGAIARDLGVNRVTLYRWVGRREQLLLRILWTLTEQTLRRQRELALTLDEPRGDRTAGILSRYITEILGNPGMLRLLTEEGELAARLLTVSEPGFQPLLVQAVADLLREDVEDGVRDLSVPLDDLAYAAVRITEAFVHSHSITGDLPDPERPRRILHVLLR